MQKTHQHGGISNAIFEKFNVTPRPIIDFSVNISPLGVPDCLLKAWSEMPKFLTAYPEIMGNGVTVFYWKKFGLPSDCVLAGNGSIELIYLIPRVFGRKKVLIPQPSFFEYNRACEIAGCEVDSGEISDLSDHDALFIGSPNNPTGKTISADEILKLADQNPEKWFIVDQAFLEFVEDQESVSLIRSDRIRKNLIVIHSLTKFYALPGLRIGAAISHPETISKLVEQKEPWTVNAIAQKACEILANDNSYDKKLLAIIHSERERLKREIGKMEPFEIQEGAEANFLLIRWKRRINLDLLLKHAIENGICLRDCRNFTNLPENCFRVAVRTPDENTQLIKTLASA